MVDMTTHVAKEVARHGCPRPQQVPLQDSPNLALRDVAESANATPALKGGHMSLELRVPGIDREDLTEITGEQGNFYISRIGGKPELENGFFYGDDKIQFCFYANINVLKEEKYDIEVFGASTSRFSGPVPKSVGSHLSVIQGNIEKLFRERNFFDPFVPSSDANRKNLHSVRFTWSVM